jgi:dTDP-4-amino-4,6-dideoxygalactose transaminase
MRLGCGAATPLRRSPSPDSGIVPFQRPILPEADAVDRYFAASRQQRWFSNEGPCWQLLRTRLETATGAACVPTASATAGLLLLLCALRPRSARGASVALMPSFTFPATAQAAIWNRLEPEFVDIAPAHWHMDPEELEAALSARRGDVAVILAVSAFGTPPPPVVRKRWRELAASYRVPLVLDSAAGFGALAEDGCPVGAQGDAEVVSFHATKPLPAGEGGAVFATDPELAGEIRRLSNFGFDDDRQAIAEFGINAKLSEQAAATVLAALDAADRYLGARREKADRILAALAGHAASQRGGAYGTWQFVPIEARDAAHRSRILAAADGRVEMRTYYDPLHRMPAFRSLGRTGPLATTEAVSAAIVSLPMAVDLDEGEIGRIVGAVRAAGAPGPGPRPDRRPHGDPGVDFTAARLRAGVDLGRLTAVMHERAAHWPERLAEIRRTADWRRAYDEPEPPVTVRIATWNRAELLTERALASVLRQSYPNWEAIVVGDACTDDTERRIAGLGDDRITFINLPVRGTYPEHPLARRLIAGIPAMNVGSSLARGAWIAPLDDDDEWDDDHLELLLGEALDKQSEFVYGRMRSLRDGKPAGAFGAWPPWSRQINLGAAVYNGALREFQLDPACRFQGEPGDWHFTRRLLEAGVRFAFVDRVVATHHRDHATAVRKAMRHHEAEPGGIAGPTPRGVW